MFQTLEVTLNRRAFAWSGALAAWSAQATMIYYVLSPISEPIDLAATFLYGVRCGRRAHKLTHPAR